MKKKICLLISVLIILSMLCSCSKDERVKLKIGFVADNNVLQSDIDFLSAWNAVKEVATTQNCEYTYAQPMSDGLQEYLNAVAELYNSGCRMIVFADEVFSNTVLEVQNKYSNCKFVCIGFALNKIAKNTVCLSFSQLESGFVAGIAAAMQIKSGSFGGIFGMDIPTSRRYYYGFTYGVEYANSNLGTNVDLNDGHIVFAGSYNDADLGKQLALSMYTSGVECIFSDGGNTGDGVFAAATEQTYSGNTSWVVDTDTDKYSLGIIPNRNSVTLTSAVYNPTPALHEVVELYFSGSFEGGKIISFTAREDTVVLPENTHNLDTEVISTCKDIISKLKNGLIILKDPTELLK